MRDTAAVEPGKLQALLAELESDAGYASGSSRFPRRIHREEAAAVADQVHEAIEHFTGQRARAAQAAGTPLACRAGCAHCCEELIMVPAPEAETVALWLSREENRAAREAFLAAFPAWTAAAGDAPQRLADATERGDLRAHKTVYLAHFRKRVPCAFNQNG